jgi:hypothetical protein
MKYLKKYEGSNDPKSFIDSLKRVAKNQLSILKEEKGFLSVDDYYKFMGKYFQVTLVEDLFHELVGEGFGFEDEPEDDGDDSIIPTYNLN